MNATLIRRKFLWHTAEWTMHKCVIRSADSQNSRLKDRAMERHTTASSSRCGNLFSSYIYRSSSENSILNTQIFVIVGRQDTFNAEPLSSRFTYELHIWIASEIVFLQIIFTQIDKSILISLEEKKMRVNILLRNFHVFGIIEIPDLKIVNRIPFCVLCV